MKKAIFSLAVLGSVMLVNTGEATAQTTKTTTTTTNTKPQKTEWKQSTNSTWAGKKDGSTYWYKTDANGKLTWSRDNKQWSEVTDNTWADYDGKWYRIENRELMQSNDGKSWSASPNQYWRGSDGTWYMFDDNWSLWTGGNGNTVPTMPAK